VADEALKEVRRGSFARVLSLSRSIDPELTEQVRQIRCYRNWLTHGKPIAETGGIQSIDPRTVYLRLGSYLVALDKGSPTFREGD
jgi:hypothetical protein